MNFDSAKYWEGRYRIGGNSGAGSYGDLAKWKANVLNELVGDFGIHSVIEFGCGDGNQLSLAHYPAYLGLDVSPTAVEQCRRRFADDSTKRFELLAHYQDEKADLVLSLDVIFHLTEPGVYETHMRQITAATDRFLAIYASDTDEQQPGQSMHMHHHRFSDWIADKRPNLELIEYLAPRPGSVSCFQIYQAK